MVLLAALALLPTLDAPVALPTRAWRGGFAIQAEMGGKTGWFLIGTSREYSYVIPGFLKEGAADYMKAEVKVGGSDLGETYVVIDRGGGIKEAGFDGVLGTDVLENCALGYDYEFGRIAFWREGRLERKDAEAWMASDAKVDRVRGWMENGALSVNLKFGGQEFLIGIAPDVPWTFLGPKAAAAAKGMKLYTTYARSSSTSERVPGVEGRITSGFSRGDLPPAYLEHIVFPAGTETSFGDGLMNPRDFNAARVIFDLPGRCVWIPQTPVLQQASRALSRLFDLPLDLSNPDARIGSPWTGYFTRKAWEKWSVWDSANVRRFGDLDPTGLKPLATPGKAAESLISSLYGQMRKGISIEVEHKGKEGAVKTDPLRIPGE